MTDDRSPRRPDAHRAATDEPRDDSLTRSLRSADPAAGETGLDAVDRARMRQAITQAAGRSLPARSRASDRQAWMSPALAAAAIAVVAVGVWSIRGGVLMETEGSATVRPSAKAPETAVTAPESVLPDTTAGAPPESAQPDATADATVDPTPVSANTKVAALEDPSPTGKPRTLQFTAPRGTRIIWTLDPNYESPIAGGEPRQEQPR